jgi:UDP-glucose 4-epimerase
VYATIAEQIGFKGEPIYGPPREGDIKHSLADITRASKELGYEPKAHFREGLRKTVAWYLAEREKKAVAAI